MGEQVTPTHNRSKTNADGCRRGRLATSLTVDSGLEMLDIRVNDPSAGSPTETLLRLLLPLSDKVH